MTREEFQALGAAERDAYEAGARDMRERAATVASDERDKLGGRWSLDSAYLSATIEAIRALPLRAEDKS